VWGVAPHVFTPSNASQPAAIQGNKL